MKKLKLFRKSINFKNTLILIALLLFTNFLGAQITVSSNGNVKLAGDLNIVPYYSTSIIQPDENNSGYCGYNGYQFYEVHSNSYWGTDHFTTSDKRLKQNFRTIEQPLEKILLLTGQKYDFIPESSDTVGTTLEKEKKDKLKKDKLGFIAQEIEKVIPEAVYYDKTIDQYFIEYNAVIPVIVEAMKEQQSQIETLKSEINSLKSASNIKSSSIEPNEGQEKLATLGQNFPNPFRETTHIVITLPQSVVKATLYIYNMQGVQIKSYPLTERGNTSVTIEGNSLKAGMYLYTLIADGKDVDTKKMILTK